MLFNLAASLLIAGVPPEMVLPEFEKVEMWDEIVVRIPGPFGHVHMHVASEFPSSDYEMQSVSRSPDIPRG